MKCLMSSDQKSLVPPVDLCVTPKAVYILISWEASKEEGGETGDA